MDFQKELEKQFIKESLGYSEEEWYKNHDEKIKLIFDGNTGDLKGAEVIK